VTVFICFVSPCMRAPSSCVESLKVLLVLNHAGINIQQLDTQYVCPTLNQTDPAELALQAGAGILFI